MHSLILIPLVALLLSACDNSDQVLEKFQADADVAAPCIAAVKALADRSEDPEYRGFQFLKVRLNELASQHYVIPVYYRSITLTYPSGGPTQRLDCELRNGQVVGIKKP